MHPTIAWLNAKLDSMPDWLAAPLVCGFAAAFLGNLINLITP